VVGTRPIAAATPVAVVSAVKTGDYADRIPCEAEDLAAYRNAGGYRQLAAIADQHEPGREAVVETLEHARLRGLGGAGFPAGRKWRIVRGQAAPRLMAVNIDEGEPGTFKDRYFLERRPHQFLEGMLIAAQVVGVDRIYVYLRDEYAGVRALLKRELESLQAAPLPAARNRAETRRRRLRLWRGIRDARIDRRSPRHATAAPALRCRGRPVRPPNARAQHGNPVLGTRDSGERRRLVPFAWPQ
jgi:formate dehydrogenase